MMLSALKNSFKLAQNTDFRVLLGVFSRLRTCNYSHNSNDEPSKPESKRLAEFRKKLRETTDIKDLGEQQQSQKEDALPAWPDNKNPHTGEVGGPRGPEPTRYGDWERKGRVTDF